MKFTTDATHDSFASPTRATQPLDSSIAAIYFCSVRGGKGIFFSDLTAIAPLLQSPNQALMNRIQPDWNSRLTFTHRRDRLLQVKLYKF